MTTTIASRLDLAGVPTALFEAGPRDAAAGPPVVLLHGPGGYGAAWRAVVPGLAERHHVVVPDLPGQGDSLGEDGPPDAAGVLDWLDALVAHTCPAPPVIVGHLVGGAIAARYAARPGARVAGLVLVVPFGLAPFAPTPEFGAALTGYLEAPAGDTHDVLWQHCVHDLAGLRARMGTGWDQLRARNLDLARDPRVARGQQALLEAFGMPAVPPEELGRIAVPVTLVWGRHDTIVRLAVGEAAADRYGWPLRVMEGVGNEPALEDPDAFVAAISQAPYSG